MDDWTDEELVASVDAYLGLLADVQSGGTPVKAAVRRQALAGPLQGRSAGSYEYRMQNISAVLHDMGRPWLEGYRPASHVGQAAKVKLRDIIESRLSSAGSFRETSSANRLMPRYVYVANFGRENFEWPNCLAGGYVATMQDERVHEYWLAGDKEGYIDFAVANLKTAKGLPPVRPVASRWFNLGTIIAESEGDLWIHRQADTLWWTMTLPDPVRLDHEIDPSARAGDPPKGIFYRKPSQAWSSKALNGRRLEWRSLHPKSHDFFSTEATLQRLGPNYAEYAIALINGDNLSSWTTNPEWRAKVVARGGNAGGKVFNARERTIAMMVSTAMRTARSSNGQQELRRVKNKEVRFLSQTAFEAYIAKLWTSQEGFCAMSGMALQCEPADDPEFCASLDRIDSDGHYEENNLQIVCRFINRWKSDDSAANFQRLMRKVQGIQTE